MLFLLRASNYAIELQANSHIIVSFLFGKGLLFRLKDVTLTVPI